MNEPTRWVTAAVLQALAAQEAAKGTVFTAGQLDGWLGGALTPEQRVNATTRLCALGFLTHSVRFGYRGRNDEYRLTADGAAAVAEAAAGQVRKSGPKAAHGKRHALDPQSLSARLWALLRMRRMIDAEARPARCAMPAAPTTARASRSAATRRWADAGAVQESARRVNAQGHKQRPSASCWWPMRRSRPACTGARGAA